MLISFSCNAGTATNGKNDYIGSWQEHRGFGVVNTVNSRLNVTENSLNITPEFNVTLKRIFNGDKAQINTAKLDDITFINDFLIIPLSRNNQVYYKLVISGWRSEHSTLIFGTLYLYDNGQLYNGIPISFKPKSANK